MDFCREHERAIALKEKQLAIQQAKIEQVISFRRRKRREFDRLFGSVFSVLVLVTIAFVLGIFSTQLFLS
ncbi:hypothetical protein [[Limnothrix rosea] IAM M-220]|uniref:hypothetical protein n=1 Tax=[Limnothrix rosea] IAM M-220 TaxID=454133 RepID=UPI00095B8E5A|nr:hypothetical protein [[Limnothrix rosea] IAM M-220]OKH17651.1 hypothetical protein NIES208_08330 [[Limnothrix rosea] IAM M-220]